MACMVVTAGNDLLKWSEVTFCEVLFGPNAVPEEIRRAMRVGAIPCVQSYCRYQ
jgi:hypothetical protein